ncbi:hypothetical protein R6231_14225 [Bacillus cytotoxicus]|uniref:hypothetical protein n=1 Tax=Bacillus cereus group TaxID=86661 RepID=UPI000B9716D6|nr:MULTISPECIES: hypothetical protein [Bacillus cereus group]AWC30970.1 hypothetical protein CG483_022385 [Bacillus cytotoxicus]AWC35079.1 hypothetical protein CG482_022770 [Bacillus cytotoxicus]AWC39045.1 hypothetical protein CG481_022360 [Bacillus cytotoxicus]AWC43062.1 hypothetical protein CG480_022220 [Bacillus cytotoxicus]AWC47025.1 hypothetical protein CG479_021730 [Bacillus cytotoxicus]
MAYEKLFQFRGNQIHVNIVQDFQKQYPEYSREADVLRHAVVLLDEKMREDKGEDNLSILKKEVKNLTKSVNTMKQQMDVLIKLNIELISRSGSDLSIEEMQQDVKKEIAAAVTRKSEGKFYRTSNRLPMESRKEETLQKEQEVQRGIKVSSTTEQKLPMIKDDDEITLVNNKPHKKIWKFGKYMYVELEWEQIPEHRLNELK